MKWFDGVKGKRLKHVFAVHGEPDNVTAMKALLKTHGFDHAVAPVKGQKFDDL